MKKDFILFLILLHAFIGIFLSLQLNVWSDEASSLFSSEGSVFEAFQNGIKKEKQAPLYFVLLSLWRDIYDSIFFARLFSLVFSLLSIKFFADLISRFFDEHDAKLLTFLFAFHPFLIWSSTEVRLYSFTVFLSIFLVKLFIGSYVEDGRRLFFVLLSVFAIYVNYYLGFLIAALYLLLLVKEGISKRFVVDNLIVIVLILPLGLFVLEQFSMNTAGFREERSFLEGIKILWNHFLSFTLPIGLFPTDEVEVIKVARNWIMRFFVILLLVLLCWKKKFLSEATIFFGGLSVVISFCLLLAYFLLGADYLQIRHASVLFVSVFLLFWFAVLNVIPRKASLLIVIICFFAYGYSFYFEYKTMAKRGDWKRVAEFITANESPGQPIIVFRVYDVLALGYHYRGINRILPDERFFDWVLEDRKDSERAFRKQIEFTISEIPAEAREIWFVTEEICHNPRTEVVCRDLENFIVSNYTILLQKDFYLERVRLLRKK